jgi:hypothetical protein
MDEDMYVFVIIKVSCIMSNKKKGDTWINNESKAFKQTIYRVTLQISNRL